MKDFQIFMKNILKFKYKPKKQSEKDISNRSTKKIRHGVIL